jgi:ParB/RepB/Spo0J family partition protein
MRIVKVDLKDIEQNENSRVIYKENDLSELMHSMKKDGLLQPVGLRKLSGNKYEAVFGNRRILAAKKLGWADIDANIVEANDDNERDILNLVENLKRQNTTVSEDGRIFQALRDRGLSVPEISARVGVSGARIELALEVFNDVPDEFKNKIVNRVTGAAKKKGEISASAAHIILNVRKSHNLTRKQTRQLMNYASEDETSLSHIAHVAPLIKNGFSVGEAISVASKLSRVVMYVFVDESRIKKLEKKYSKSITTLLWDQLEKNTELGVKRMPSSKFPTKRTWEVRKTGQSKYNGSNAVAK